MKRHLLMIALFVSLAPLLAAIAGAGHGQEGLEREFAEVCAKTDDAMKLAGDELRSLVNRCDEMKSRAEGLPEPGRKVFLRRLQMCRDLYAFTLQSRQSKTTNP
jgi:hypothetical protein